jgi:N-acetylmuramoyl-L-alanine amidase
MPADLPIHDWPLPYEARLDERPTASIDLIVVHCTELPDLASAREYGERVHYASSKTGNSGHYYIDRDGAVHRFVADQRIAHHVVGYNARAIGIELVNRGRYPNWLDTRHQQVTDPYSDAQIVALLALVRQLKTQHPSIRYLTGHEDLDRRLEPASDNDQVMLPRRRDPGPLFPWPRVEAESGLDRLYAPD